MPSTSCWPPSMEPVGWAWAGQSVQPTGRHWRRPWQPCRLSAWSLRRSAAPWRRWHSLRGPRQQRARQLAEPWIWLRQPGLLASAVRGWRRPWASPKGLRQGWSRRSPHSSCSRRTSTTGRCWPLWPMPMHGSLLMRLQQLMRLRQQSLPCTRHLGHGCARAQTLQRSPPWEAASPSRRSAMIGWQQHWQSPVWSSSTAGTAGALRHRPLWPACAIAKQWATGLPSKLRVALSSSSWRAWPMLLSQQMG
mmetsp:Transcript_103722/g.334383  ORF Transcript_103722/g.334383 Transcript_103722/m.334383 type:complete len:249 (+) Transcript_103722:542-1288(+)